MALPYGRRAFLMLARLLKTSADDKVRLAAAREILDRAYGRPMTPSEITGKDGAAIALANVTPLAVPELARRLAWIYAEARREEPTNLAGGSARAIDGEHATTSAFCPDAATTAPPVSRPLADAATASTAEPFLPISPDAESETRLPDTFEKNQNADPEPPAPGGTLRLGELTIVNVGPQRENLPDCYTLAQADGATLASGAFARCLNTARKFFNGELPKGD